MSALKEFRDKIIRYGLESLNLFYANYDGIVLDNDDPEKRGRLKVSCPAVWHNNGFNKWVQPRGVFAGKGFGFHAMPEEGDTVTVNFANGDPNYPRWEYGWWVKDGAIEQAGKGVYVFSSPKGHVWVVDDNEGSIYFSYKGGKAIEIAGNAIHLGTVGGASQPAVLGNTLEEFLNEFISDLGNISAITVVTPSGPGTTNPITTSPNWAALVAKWNLKWQEIKSGVVNLD